MSDHIIEGGKYKGESIHDIPLSYAAFLVANPLDNPVALSCSVEDISSRLVALICPFCDKPLLSPSPDCCIAANHTAFPPRDVLETGIRTQAHKYYSGPWVAAATRHAIKRFSKADRRCLAPDCPSKDTAMPAIGNARDGGANHADFEQRLFHKRCFKKLSAYDRGRVSEIIRNIGAYTPRK